jgi:hypothetical protein
MEMQSVLVSTTRDIYAVIFYLEKASSASAEFFITEEKM